MGAEIEIAHGLRRLPPLWALIWIPLTPVVCPPMLLFYFGVYATQGISQGISLVFLIVCWWSLDLFSRKPLNDNVMRVESARVARAEAAQGQEPVALLLRAFREDLGYVDAGGSFSLYELIEPALRETGFRPFALGTNLPLRPSHGVAMIETTDAAWWEVFTSVAEDAAVIVVMPQDTPSLGRELHWIGERGLLSKVAVVMAPEALSIAHYPGADAVVSQGPAADNKGRAAAWGTVRQVWSAALGVELPIIHTRSGAHGKEQSMASTTIVLSGAAKQEVCSGRYCGS